MAAKAWMPTVGARSVSHASLHPGSCFFFCFVFCLTILWALCEDSHHRAAFSFCCMFFLFSCVSAQDLAQLPVYLGAGGVAGMAGVADRRGIQCDSGTGFLPLFSTAEARECGIKCSSFSSRPLKVPNQKSAGWKEPGKVLSCTQAARQAGRQAGSSRKSSHLIPCQTPGLITSHGNNKWRVGFTVQRCWLTYWADGETAPRKPFKLAPESFSSIRSNPARCIS